MRSILSMCISQPHQTIISIVVSSSLRRNIMANRLHSLDTALLKCYDHDLDWSLLPTRIRKVSSYFHCYYVTYCQLYRKLNFFFLGICCCWFSHRLISPLAFIRRSPYDQQIVANKLLFNRSSCY